MQQHLSTAIKFIERGIPAVFSLFIMDAKTDPVTRTVVSNGKGLFTGPLKSRTPAQRDELAKVYTDLSSLRHLLDQTAGSVVMIVMAHVDDRQFSVCSTLEVPTSNTKPATEA